jgi:hypothetical protein
VSGTSGIVGMMIGRDGGGSRMAKSSRRRPEASLGGRAPPLLVLVD